MDLPSAPATSLSSARELQRITCKVTLSQLRSNAIEVAKQIKQIVTEKNIDLDNLVVMIGEQHRQLPAKLWQYYFMEELKNAFDKFTVCSEEQNQYQDTLQAPDDLSPSNLPTCLNDSNKNLSNQTLRRDHFFPSYATKIHGLKYQAVNMNIYEGTFDFSQTLPDDFITPYQHCPVVLKAYNRVSSTLAKLAKNEEVNAREYDSMIIRDLYEMNAVCLQSGMVMTINGQNHVVDEKREDRIALIDMLLDTGKDVIAVRQHWEELPPYDYYQHTQIYKRLPDDQKDRFHALFYATLPKDMERDFSAPRIKEIMEMQRL